MKEVAKKDPGLNEKFKKYDVDIAEVDDVFVAFEPLDVSAKTKNMKIYINEKFLNEGHDPTHYLIHELVHYLQQKTGKTRGHQMVSEYLDKPTEEEAFQTQIDFKEKVESPEEAEKYVEKLLDHHDYKGKEREEKKKELLD